MAQSSGRTRASADTHVDARVPSPPQPASLPPAEFIHCYCPHVGCGIGLMCQRRVSAHGQLCSRCNSFSLEGCSCDCSTCSRLRAHSDSHDICGTCHDDDSSAATPVSDAASIRQLAIAHAKATIAARIKYAARGTSSFSRRLLNYKATRSRIFGLPDKPPPAQRDPFMVNADPAVRLFSQVSYPLPGDKLYDRGARASAQPRLGPGPLRAAQSSGQRTDTQRAFLRVPRSVHSPHPRKPLILRRPERWT